MDDLWIGLDPDKFAAKAQDFITADIDRNVLATVFEGVKAGRYAEAIFAVISDADGATVAAAMRTPPHHLMVAGPIDEPFEFMALWTSIDPAPSGVAAERRLAEELAAAYRELTGRETDPPEAEALHVLTEVIWPERRAPGRLRRANFRDSAQLGEWGLAFALDAGLRNGPAIAASMQHSIEQERFYVWETEAGQTVSMIGHSPEIDGTYRVGPVYTPRELRGHGYATVMTAELSELLLETGAERCILYTDLANPISNHIYAKIGYVRHSDRAVIPFST